MGGAPDKVASRGPKRFAYRCRVASVSGSRGGATGRSPDAGEQPAGERVGAGRCCFWSHGEPPDRRRQEYYPAGTFRSPLDTAQRCFGNTCSDHAYACWSGKGAATARGRRRRPHGSGRGSRPTSTGRGAATNRGADPSVRRQLAAPATWSEGGQRRRGRN